MYDGIRMIAMRTMVRASTVNGSRTQITLAGARGAGKPKTGLTGGTDAAGEVPGTLDGICEKGCQSPTGFCRRGLADDQ